MFLGFLLPLFIQSLTVQANLVFTTESGDISVPAYPLLRWNLHFDYNNLTVVHLQSNPELFDYCDLSQYTEEGVAPLLEYYNVTNNIKWIAFFETGYYCDDLQAKYVNYWTDAIAGFIQQTGATGFIDLYYSDYPHFTLTNIDYVDKKLGQSFGLDSNKIFGAVITEQIDEFVASYEQHVSEGIPFVVSINDSRNELVEAWFQPIYGFYYFVRIMPAIEVLICFICLLYCLDGLKQLQQYSSYIGISLIFATLGTIFRLILSIDAYAFFGILPNSVITIFGSFSYSFHAATVIPAISVWIYMVLYELHDSGYKYNSILVKVMYILLALTYIILDAYNTVLNYIFGYMSPSYMESLVDIPLFIEGLVLLLVIIVEIGVVIFIQISLKNKKTYSPVVVLNPTITAINTESKSVTISTKVIRMSNLMMISIIFGIITLSLNVAYYIIYDIDESVKTTDPYGAYLINMFPYFLIQISTLMEVLSMTSAMKLT